MAQTLQQLSQNSTGVINKIKTPTNVTVTGLTLPSMAKKSSGLVNSGSGAGLAANTIPTPPSSIGIKTKSPTDNLKTPSNTTPQPQVQKPASSGNTTEGGTQNTNGTLPHLASTTTPTASNQPGPSGPYTANSGLQGQLITGIANTANAANDPNSRISKAYQTKEDLEKEYAAQTAANSGNPIPLSDQVGRAGIYASRFGQLENAANTGITNALTGQGQTVSGLTSAASANAPTGNIINVSPITGQPIAGGTLPELAKTAGTIQGLQSGSAALAATGGNIAAQNATALGTAATGADAKSIGDFTNQINTTQKSVQTLDNLKNQIIPGMGVAGFNPTTSPIGNQTFSQYFTEKNPAAKAGIMAGLGDIKNQISNVISSATGLTPTGVTSVTDGYDFTSLNPQQLSDFLDYINQYAQSNIKAAQDSVDIISKGGTPRANPGPLPAPEANSIGQATGATGAAAAKGLISSILSSAKGAISEAAGVGLAAKVLL